MEEAQTNTEGGTFPGLPAAAPDPATGPSGAESHEGEGAESNGGAPPASPGYAPPVDLSDLPPEKRAALEGRFAHLSRLMKKNDTRLNEYRTIAEAQSRQIEELMSGVGQVVDHLQTKSFTETEQQIQQQLRQAHESGDMNAWLAANDKLAEIKAQKIASQQKPQRSTATPELNRNQPRNAAEIAQAGVEAGELDPREAVIAEAWAAEADDSGLPVRPWTDSSDPRFREAFLETQSVFSNKRYASLSFQKKLEEVDRRMGVARSTAAQSVMGGNLTTGRKNGKMTLSPEQERMAIKMRAGGPKAKSDADHIAKYRQQLEKIQASKKGTRQ